MNAETFANKLAECEPVLRKELSKYDAGYHTTEDLIQDAYLRAWRSRSSYTEGTNFLAWVTRIAKNGAINAWRRDRLFTRILTGEPHAIRILTRSDPPAEPDGVLNEFGGKERVHELLDQLPTEFRMPLIMFEMHGISYRGIAAEMDCPVGSVMSRLHRGRRMFRGLVEEEFTRSEIGEVLEDPDPGPAWQEVEPDWEEFVG